MTISNHDDVIDSRDVIARIEELEAEREALRDALTDATEERDAMPPENGPEPISDAYHDAHCAVLDADQDLTEWDASDEAAELAELKALQEQAEGYAGDWRHGATLVRDSYFRCYAQELAEDIGALDRNASWPYTCIDWDRAARELRMDYTAVDFAGVAYWVR